MQRVILVTALAMLAFVLVRRCRARERAAAARARPGARPARARWRCSPSSTLLDKFGVRPRDRSTRSRCSMLTAVPIIFLVGLLRARLARSAIGDLLVDLREPAEPGALRDALARALRDPTLELAYWVPEYEAYVGADGEPVELPATTRPRRRRSSSAAATPRRRARPRRRRCSDEPRAGRRGHLRRRDRARERAPAGRPARAPERPAGLARADRRGRRHRPPQARARPPRRRPAAARLALDRAARWSPASCRRTARRRSCWPAARDELTASLEELRGIAQRHPPRGPQRPRPAGRARVAGRPRAGRASTLDVDLDERLPEPVEVAAYYLVAEGLTNVAKYAERRARDASTSRARTARSSSRSPTTARAAPTRRSGSGLRGLADRVEALDGRLQVWSPAGRRDTAASGDPMRVVLADDTMLLREGVALLLGEAGFDVVGQAGDRRGARRAASATHAPDVAIVDLRMPPTHTDEGLQAALTIRAAAPRTSACSCSPSTPTSAWR